MIYDDNSKASINDIKVKISKLFKKYNIKKVATFNKRYITDIYNVNIITNSTKTFFAFINELIKQNKSIIINFPITFEKAADKLEITFKLYISYKKN